MRKPAQTPPVIRPATPIAPAKLSNVSGGSVRFKPGKGLKDPPAS